jgi:putative phage-type endonuclease
MMEQRSTEWHNARKGRVTGSIVGAILGLAPYMTRDQAMRSMVRAYHGAEREFTGNVATEYGTAMEQEAIEAFEFKTGLTVQKAPFVPFEDWLGASPDGYIGNDDLIEAKCPFGLRKDENPQFKSIWVQPHYYAQIQIQLYVTSRSGCFFWQWSANGDALEYVMLDQEWLDQNLPVLRQFYAEYLSELDNPEHLEPLRKEINTQDARRLLDEYDQLSEAIDNATERRKEVMTTLQDMAGGNNALIWGRKLTKVEKVGPVKYADVVKKHLPELDLEPYRGKPSTIWRLS